MRSTEILLKKPGFFAKAFQFLNPKNKFLVGYDLEGNRFLERPSSEPGSRTKRTVEYVGKLEHISDAIARNRNLSVQWKAWLSHTRVEAPTIQELENDMKRRQDLLYSVRNIQMREKEEIARMEDARRATLSSLPFPSSPPAPDLVSASRPDLHTLSSPSANVKPDPTVRNQQTDPAGPTTQHSISRAPILRGPSESSVQLDPTPETDPLRLESQRALQQEQEQQKQKDKGALGESPVIGTRIQEEWKPEGWSPSVSRRKR